MTYRLVVNSLFSLVFVAVMATSAMAQSTWTGAAGDDNWHTAGNWTNGVPTTAADAVFDASGTYTVNFSSHGVAQQLRIEGGTVTLDGNGTTRTLNISSGSNFITGGNLTLKQMILQFNGGNIFHRDGDLRLENGSQLNNTGNYNLGQGANSDVTVTGGSTVETGQVRIYDGNITIDGPGSKWTSTNVFGVGRGSGETANLNITNGGEVDSAGALVANENNTTGNVTIDGAGSSWTSSGTTLFLGNQGNGSVTVSNGGLFEVTNAAANLELGRSGTTGSSGTLRVETDGIANIAGNLFVGGTSTAVGGTGILDVLNGGSINVGGTTQLWNDGTLNLDGGSLTTGLSLKVSGDGTVNLNDGRIKVGNTALQDSSTQIDIGRSNSSAPALLEVLGGGEVVNSGHASIGTTSDSFGIATVAGDGSRWTNSSSLVIGDRGSGTLNVEVGGLVENTQGIIGFDTGSTGIASITGAGSRWNNSIDLFVGFRDNGALNVEAGGRVDNTNAFIGHLSSSTGVATVAGEGSHWANSGNLAVGNSGIGTLNINNNGLVSVQGTTSIGTNGTVNLNGGSLTTGSFDNSAMAGFSFNEFNFNEGTFTVDGGTFTPGTDTFHTDSVSGTARFVLKNGAVSNVSGLTDVGVSGNGIFEVLSGSTHDSAGGSIGDLAGSTGTATVNGANSKWSATAGLVVGNSGTGTLDVTGGGVVSSTTGTIGSLAGSTGTVTIDGAGSQWNNSGSVTVGDGSGLANAIGTLNVQNNGLVNVGDTATLWSGATLNLDGGSLTTGSFDQGAGTLNFDGGTLTVDGGNLALASGVFGLDSASGKQSTINLRNSSTWNQANVFMGNTTDSNTTINLESGSELNTLAELSVGRQTGTSTLNISGGSTAYSPFGTIGIGSGSTGTVNVDGVDSEWTNWQLRVGAGVGATSGGTGTLNVDNGGIVTVDGSSGSQASLLRVVGKDGTVNLNDGRIKVGNTDFGSFDTYIDIGGTSSSHPARLKILAGGELVNSGFAIIGQTSGSFGVATVDGAGSEWNNSGSLQVGIEGTGSLDVTHGGVVSSRTGWIGFESGSTGTVTVDGADSQWNNSFMLAVGHNQSSTGSLDVTRGGTVSSQGGIIGFESGSTGTMTVDGADSQWNNSSSLAIGLNGTGTLNINNGGLVTVGGTTSIGTNGTVSLGGGRFEFGSTDLTTFGRIGGTSGSLKGDVDMSGIHNVANLTAFQTSTFDISEVSVANTGTLYGSAFLDSNLINQSSGELRTLGTDFVRFEGIGNANSGQINNYGGFTEFANDLTNNDGGEINVSGVLSASEITNESGGTIDLTNGNLIADQTIVNELGGLITGRGVIRADDGFTNEGNLAFSGGTTDFRGKVNNNRLIISSGNSTTTFFNGLENQSEIRTADGSSVVVFEEFSGAGSFTGTGDVFLEGSVNGGNSPAVIGFGGNLTLSSTSATLIELAGLGLGEFDRFEVGGDLHLNGGDLNWTTLDGFQLDYDQEFVVADISGNLFGQFNGFDEGDLLGNHNGQDLFITYAGGDGNDVAFFTTRLTAVPEPSSAMILIGLAVTFTARRRRSKSC